MVFTILTDTGAVVAGLLGRYLLVGAGGNFEALLGADGERVLPELVGHLFPPVIVGLYVAAVLAATMSTIDSLLVVASSAVTRDVYQQTWKPQARSEESLTRLSRWTTLGWPSWRWPFRWLSRTCIRVGRSSGTSSLDGPA